MRASKVIGFSVHHRPIAAVEIVAGRPHVSVLVVGCIHGDETAGIAVADALTRGPSVPGVDLWVVPDANPDGVAAVTRGNADGVDLNRNFPDAWRKLDRPGGLYYAGSAPLSEPESRALAGLVGRVRPRLGIWFHQHLRVVDNSEGPHRQEALFAALVGLPVKPLLDYPGSAIGWENSIVPHSAFAVELAAGQLDAASVQRYADAVRTVSRSVRS